METYSVELTGRTPLLHHKMTEAAIMKIITGAGDKGGKKKVKESKLPRDVAEEHAYKTKEGLFYIPMGYVSGAFKHVAADYKQSNSKRTYKAIAGGVFMPVETNAILTDLKGKPLKDFEVDIAKGTNHLAGAVIICRPRFDEWKCKFTIEIDESLISAKTAQDILEDAGKRAGIGSFRVCKGGTFGKFSVTKFQPLK